MMIYRLCVIIINDSSEGIFLLKPSSVYYCLLLNIHEVKNIKSIGCLIIE